MTTLIFVHGFWTTPRIWEQYQNYFHALGYQTKALALPQHFSRNQPQHPEGLSLVDYLDYLEEEFRAIAINGGKIVVAGHGMGAVLALQLAMRVDPDALLLLSPEAPSPIGSALPPARALVDTCTTPSFGNGVLSRHSARHEIFCSTNSMMRRRRNSMGISVTNQA